MHIDGGHNADEALGDLRLAAEVTVPGGIIALDDAINPVWPGVAEGLMCFLRERADYCVALLGFNKAILCRRDVANMYVTPCESEGVRNGYGLTYPWHLKQLPLAGFSARIFFVPSYVSTSSMGARLHRLYYANQWTRESDLQARLEAPPRATKRLTAGCCRRLDGGCATCSRWSWSLGNLIGGEGGIRTPVPVTRQDAFEAPPLRPLRYLSVINTSGQNPARPPLLGESFRPPPPPPRVVST